MIWYEFMLYNSCSSNSGTLQVTYDNITGDMIIYEFDLESKPQSTIATFRRRSSQGNSPVLTLAHASGRIPTRLFLASSLRAFSSNVSKVLQFLINIIVVFRCPREIAGRLNARCRTESNFRRGNDLGETSFRKNPIGENSFRIINSFAFYLGIEASNPRLPSYMRASTRCFGTAPNLLSCTQIFQASDGEPYWLRVPQSKIIMPRGSCLVRHLLLNSI